MQVGETTITPNGEYLCNGRIDIIEIKLASAISGEETTVYGMQTCTLIISRNARNTCVVELQYDSY